MNVPRAKRLYWLKQATRRSQIAKRRNTGIRTMTTQNHGSATIYQFPARGRFAVNAEAGEAKAVLPHGAKLAVGGAWYHDEAIRTEDDKQAS